MTGGLGFPELCVPAVSRQPALILRPWRAADIPALVAEMSREYRRTGSPTGTSICGWAADPVAAHIDGSTARLTEARVSIMQRKTKRRPDAFAAERRRTAPYTRPDKISASTFPLVRATHSDGLRSRERRFESCRGHWSEV